MARWVKILALLALCILCVPAAAQERREIPPYRTYGAPAAPEQAAELATLLQQFKAAWGRQDVEALMALHAPDVEWINAYARMFQGADGLHIFLAEQLFPAFDPAVSSAEAEGMTLISTRYLNDDAAILHLYTDGPRGPSRNADEQLRRTHFHLVIERRSEGWRIVHVAIMDAR